MWAITKYLAELDFRQRRQQGQPPLVAWAAVRLRLAELLEPSGYSLTYFTPELAALREALVPAHGPESEPDLSADMRPGQLVGR